MPSHKAGLISQVQASDKQSEERQPTVRALAWERMAPRRVQTSVTETGIDHERAWKHPISWHVICWHADNLKRLEGNGRERWNSDRICRLQGPHIQPIWVTAFWHANVAMIRYVCAFSAFLFGLPEHGHRATLSKWAFLFVEVLN